MGFLTDEDSTLYRNWFKEMAYLRGIKVGYQYVINKEMTIHSEALPKLSEPIPMDIIFEENPKVDTLQKLGWLTETGSNTKPVIAQIPFDAQNLTMYARIIIPPFVEIQSRSRVFEVRKIATILEYPDCWTVQLAPVYDNDEHHLDYSETNYNYTETNKDPKKGSVDISGDDNYSFISED